MVVAAIEAAPGLGVERISLNFAVLRSVFARAEELGAGPVIRLWSRVLRAASRLWQIESLYRANAKYLPAWQPRFLCFPSARDLPRIEMLSRKPPAGPLEQAFPPIALDRCWQVIGSLPDLLRRAIADLQRVRSAAHVDAQSRPGIGVLENSLAHVATAGLACRVGGDWRVVTTAAAANEGSDVHQAASPSPAVLHAIEARISGDALDAAGEENARNTGWNPEYGRR